MNKLGRELNSRKDLILEWGKKRKLINKNDSAEAKEQKIGKQFLKIFEEKGETIKAYLSKDLDLLKDGFGDIFVTYVISLAQNEIDIDFEKLNYNLESSSIEYLDGHMFNLIYNLASYKSYVSNKVTEGVFIEYEITELINNSVQACDLLDIDYLECIDLAWNQIKDRKGKLVNGTYVKDGK